VTTYDLWPHQRQTISRTYAAINAGSRATLIVLPQRGGKTRTVFEIFTHAMARGRRCVFAAHRRGLVEQAAQKFADYSGGYIKPSVFMPGHTFSPSSRFVVASIQSLRAREFALLVDDVVCVDEAHLAHACDLVASASDVMWLGLTATPLTSSGRHLGDTWRSLVIGARPSELLGKFIREPDVYTHDEDGVVGGAGAMWRRHADGLRTLAFCSSHAHAKACAADYDAAGVRAVVHTDKTKRDERDADFARLRARALDVIVNVGLYKEGTDVPWLEAVHDMAPTESLASYLQACARVGCVSDEKRACVLVDASGNWMRYGPVFADQPWALTTSQRDLEMIDAPVLRQCARCGSRFPVTCPRCGDVGAAVPHAVAAHAAGSLRRMTPEEREAMLRAQEELKEEARLRKQEEANAKRMEREALTKEMARIRSVLRGIASDMIKGRDRGAWSHRAKTWEDEFRTVAGDTAASVRAAWPGWLAGLRRRVDR